MVLDAIKRNLNHVRLLLGSGKSIFVLASQQRTLSGLSAASDSLLSQNHNLKKVYASFSSIESFCEGILLHENASSLDLGCGSFPRNPFQADRLYGVDLRGDLSASVRQANLSLESIPFESSSFDYCTAFDFLEHVPRVLACEGTTRFCFVELMSDIYRVLKPGGLFLHKTPGYPAKQAFQDPTHVNIITEDTMPIYFCEPPLLAAKLGYGFDGCFELVRQGWIDREYIVTAMRAIK